MMEALVRFIFMLCFIKATLQVKIITDQEKEMANMLHKSCSEEVGGIDSGLMDKANKGEFIPDNKLKCYMKCILFQLAAMQDDGQLDEEALIGLSPEMGLKYYKNCKNHGAGVPDLCEAAFNFYKCFFSVEPNDYYLP